MNTLNESTIQICNNYSDGKNNEIKEILNRSLEQLKQKSFEMKTMIYQFEENAKKSEGVEGWRERWYERLGRD